MFTREWFLDLDSRLRAAGLDSDSQTFDEILSNLQNPKTLNPDQFASAAAYVILAGGFSQKTAKIKHAEIMEYLTNYERFSSPPVEGCPQGGVVFREDTLLQDHPVASRHPSTGGELDRDEDLINGLLKIFNNKNKMNAIIKIWQNRNTYTDNYYRITDNESRITFLSTLPHIGKITANHLARNMGENVVKYDVWIQRLGYVFAQQKQSVKLKVESSDIDNGKLNHNIKNACDDMFAHLEKQTGHPRGYIDVVLWKSCQQGLIHFAGEGVTAAGRRGSGKK